MIERRRRLTVVLAVAVLMLGGALYESYQTSRINQPMPEAKPAITADEIQTGSAVEALGKLAVKGRAPKAGYKRAQFGNGWDQVGLCDVRNHVLKRDMTDVKTVSDTDCTVLSGKLDDPYTGRQISFMRGQGSSDDVQIDHVVALSNAWQTGAQQMTSKLRGQFANDSLNLLAVDGLTNQKGDADAATWLPPNKAYRCRYVARQIATKVKYVLWVTGAEHDAMARVLGGCPGQQLPQVIP